MTVRRSNSIQSWPRHPLVQPGIPLHCVPRRGGKVRFRKGIADVAEHRQLLGNHRAVVQLERRHEALQVDPSVRVASEIVVGHHDKLERRARPGEGNVGGQRTSAGQDIKLQRCVQRVWKHPSCLILCVPSLPSLGGGANGFAESGGRCFAFTPCTAAVSKDDLDICDADPGEHLT